MSADDKAEGEPQEASAKDAKDADADASTAAEKAKEKKFEDLEYSKKAQAEKKEPLPEGMKELGSGDWEESTSPGVKKRDPNKFAPPWKKWGFVIVPLVGVIELGLHLYQTHNVVSDADWKAAREAVKAQLKPDDGVVFAPTWADPLGREFFGEDIITMERAGRADDTRYARVFEVGIRGDHAKELDGWKKIDVKETGAVTISTFENPSPAKIIDDLLKHVSPDTMSVERVEANGSSSQCPWQNGPVQAVGTYYPYGPALPGPRFQCPQAIIGITVIQALDHSARRCLLAPPIGGPTITRLHFPNVTFGTALHGHHGIHYDSERWMTGSNVNLTFRVGSMIIGHAIHQDGQGWAGFEFPTEELNGQKAELIVDIQAATSTRRVFCFEADTR